MKANQVLVAMGLMLLVLILPARWGEKFVPSNFDADQLSANLARVWSVTPPREKVLANYPFPRLSPPVVIAEGFAAYDGNLRDKPGEAHWAIDYTQPSGNKFLSFPVFSTHEGVAIQGEGKSWGKFVVVKKRNGRNRGYNTLYSHLANIPPNIPFMTGSIDDSPGVTLPTNSYLGDASVTGNTKRIAQLHFEFHLVNPATETTLRADPYGLYARLSAGQYPPPGNSLAGLPHYWLSDLPPFAAL